LLKLGAKRNPPKRVPDEGVPVCLHQLASHPAEWRNARVEAAAYAGFIQLLHLKIAIA
jgi:hypothetical protein